MDDEFNPWADEAAHNVPLQRAQPQPQFHTETVSVPNNMSLHSPPLKANALGDWKDSERANGIGSNNGATIISQQAAPMPEAKPPAAFDPWSGFDDFATLSVSGEPSAPSFPRQEQKLSPSPVPPVAEDPRDSFGAFEQSAASNHDSSITHVSRSTAAPATKSKTDESVFFPRPQPLWSAVTTERKTPKPKRTSPRPPGHENVLFDAEDVSDEDGDEDGLEPTQAQEEVDEFGDFEEAEVARPVQDQREAVRSSRAIESLPARAATSTSPRPPREPLGSPDRSPPLSKRSPLSPNRLPASASQRLNGTAKETVHKTSHDQSLLDLDFEPETTPRDPAALPLQHSNGPPSRGPAITPEKASRFDPFGSLDAAFGPQSHANGRPLEAKHPEAKTTAPYNNGCTSPVKKLEQPPRQNRVPPRKEPNAHPPASKSKESDPSEAEADAWGDWEEPAASTVASDSSPQSDAADSALHLPQLFKVSNTQMSIPPSNVPPPAVLLSLFPPIFQTVQTILFNPLTFPNVKDRNAPTTHPSVPRLLKDYLTIAIVLAHIIAGRKHRWKRDTRLAQSMSIGEAGTKASGMKLTSLDKSESTREERDVANVVKAWKLQVGKLRAALSAAGTSGLHIPEIAEMLTVRTAQQSEGALTAVKPCVICALKRNERVQNVDVNVEDSFGEWWVEHWGHRACRGFWGTYEEGLRSR